MAVVHMSQRNQIVVPREVRAHLKLRPGDELIVVPVGPVTILSKKLKRPAKALSGIARGLWEDPQAFLREERANWERTPGR